VNPPVEPTRRRRYRPYRSSRARVRVGPGQSSTGYTHDVPNHEELAYYRNVEDLFATLRGVPHTLSSKDFQLLRSWWREQIPLSAVTAGITEVFARRRERGDDGPIVSLSYCRHAVARHAKRVAEMRVGDDHGKDVSQQGPSTVERLASLVNDVKSAAEANERSFPEIAEILHRMADQLRHCDEMPLALLEDHLFSLETVLLDSCWDHLPDARQREIDERARSLADASGAEGDALSRTRRAMRDRELRTKLHLPRLELT
jgi:hypothetical protein